MATCVPLDDRPTFVQVRQRLLIALNALEFCCDHIGGSPRANDAARTLRDIVENEDIVEGNWKQLMKLGKAR